jgi:putative ABC transport system permease protein
MTVRVYRALVLLLLPTGFNDAFAEELVSVYADLDRAARARSGRAGAWRALIGEIPGLVRIAFRERRTHRTLRARRVAPRLEENMFDSLAQDATFAIRSLRRSLGFTIVAVGTLALGIGANTAIFSVVNSVLLSPLKLYDPDRLLAVGEDSKAATTPSVRSTSPASFFDWKTSSRTMDLGAYDPGYSRTLIGMGEPQQLVGTLVTGGLMDILGVRPLIGRNLTPADEDPGAPPVFVLSFDAWHRLFGEDRDVVGKAFTVNGLSRTIVGVMPSGFTFPAAPNDLWFPAQLDATARVNRDQYFLSVLGRLRPGIGIELARGEMNAVMDRLTRDWPKFNQGNRIVVEPLRDTIVGSVQSRLYVLMGAVAFVLLITCANIGNLLVARAAARRREIAVRRALGAGTGRIARQLITESVMLAVIGGGAGVAIGKSFLKLLLAGQVTTNLPRVEEISLDSRVLLFTLGVSLVVGLLFGCMPAWHLTRERFTDGLREGARGSARQQWTRNTLVVVEVALAMILLTGAGLLLRSFALMARVDTGVKPEQVATLSIQRRKPDPSFVPTLVERLRGIPGVQSVAITSMLPISGRGIGAWFNRIDRPLPDNVQPSGEGYRVVTPEYFTTVGIPLKAGRMFDANDRREAPAIIVNEALVKKYYPNENPLGKPVYLGAPDNRLFDSAPIVGVVADTRDAGLGLDPLPTVYIPFAVMRSWPFYSVVIRHSGSSAPIIASARGIVRDIDATIPITNVQTLAEVVSNATAAARWSTTLLGVFAGVALVTAVLGVFGLLSYMVTQGARELGIRIALGASSSGVQRLVLSRGLGLVGAGLAVGLAGALILTRFMQSLLYGISPTDPITFFGVAVVLLVAAAAASFIPARRATRIDPIAALRAE